MLAATLLVALAAPLAPLAEEEAATPSNALTELLNEIESTQEAFWTKFQAAETEEAKEALFAEYPDPAKYAGRFMEIATANPGTDAERDALIWVAQNVRGPQKTTALEGLLGSYIESKALSGICSGLRYEPGELSERFLRAVLEKSPHRAVRGQAIYNLAHVTSDQAESKKLFDTVVADYGDLEHFKGTLADAAKGDIFEVENLGIGMVAPEIEGDDIDGVSFKLSDYRGRVVVLDFWGDW